jgi:NAD(P)-dependent dehydrogenase (short-subunit alcohol dehydrogenase family)
MPLLQNHIAVVTGAASGIGRAIAIGYAREGAQVALLDINENGAGEAAQEIRRAGGQAESFALDVTRREDCIAVAKKSPTRSDRSRSWSTMPASTAATPSPPSPRRC